MKRALVALALGIGYVAVVVVALTLAWYLAPHAGLPSAGPLLTPIDRWRGFLVLAPSFATLGTVLAGAIVSRCTLMMQLGAARDLERLKKITEKAVPAPGDLYSAAAEYYRALAPLQTGDFSPDVVERAESHMKTVEASFIFVPDNYSEEWMNFWQRAFRGISTPLQIESPIGELRQRISVDTSTPCAQLPESI
jgi:hypothetical protein